MTIMLQVKDRGYVPVKGLTPVKDHHLAVKFDFIVEADQFKIDNPHFKDAEMVGGENWPGPTIVKKTKKK